ncbi:unnamed protein product [Porites evermanni]|uniref:Uncharacterized protein n=1 Tax=Porites evermanni TaxID=104178 RepID=A0ABN8MFR8_9CNID|nr:unnamed protein product [Porites evermanni]
MLKRLLWEPSVAWSLRLHFLKINQRQLPGTPCWTPGSEEASFTSPVVTDAVGRYPMTKLKKIHQPYGSLSTPEIKQARSHAKMHGPGTITEIKTKHRVRLDMGKVDHFVEFIDRLYFYQDVSNGNKVLTLDNGDRIEMPNVVRILTKHQTKTHIVRSINKEKVKQDALKSEDPQSAILIMEWAMKFLQIKFREKQSEWFGKRGLSWHISTLITKNVDSGKIELKSYAHIFDFCQQD